MAIREVKHVSVPDRTEVHNAMRMIPNGDGAEVIFTVVRQPGMTDRALASSAAAVEADLRSLKTLLERSDAA